MPAIARVMIVDDGESSGQLVASVRAQGFEAVRESLSVTPAEVYAQHPDLIVVDGRSQHDSGLELTRSLKADPATEALPVVLINEDMTAASQRDSLDAGATDVIAPPANAAAFGFRVRALVRLEVMRGELKRRRTIMERFAIDLPSADFDHLALHGSRLLVLGSGEADEEEIAACLDEIFVVDRSGDVIDALGQVSANAYDAVVVLAGEATTEQMVEFCADIRRNVSFFNLPVLLVLPPTALDAAEAAHRERVSDVLFSPVTPEDLRQQLLVWIRHWRYREQLIMAARNTKSLVTIDGLTGLSSYGFFRDYLKDLIADCEAGNKTFALGIIKVADVPEINDAYGYSAGDHLLRQVGQIVNQLVRVEDLAARFRGMEFSMLLPQTGAEAAQLVVDRVAGVVTNTDFLVMGCPHALRPRLSAGLITYAPGDSDKSMLDAALAAVE